MSRKIEKYISPQYEELEIEIEINHEHHSGYSSGSIKIVRDGMMISNLGFEVFDLYFDGSKIEIKLPQIDTPYNEQGKGYGSIALQKLIKYAIELNADKITGSIWHQGDIKQLEAFYKKNFATLAYERDIPTSFSIDLTNPVLCHTRIETLFFKKRMEYLEPYRAKHIENMKFVTELALRNRKEHWLIKLARKVVNEER